MNFESLSSRVIGKVKKIGEKKLASGIIIPEDPNKASNPYREIEVLDVGRGFITQNGDIAPMETKVGDRVILMNVAPYILPKDTSPDIADDEELVIFNEQDIFCRVKRTVKSEDLPF